MPPRAPFDNRASITLALGLEATLAESGVTRHEIADRIGCSPQYVTELLKRRRNPSQTILSQLAEILGRTPAALYHRGELALEEQNVVEAKKRRREVERRQNREAILAVLPQLPQSDLDAIAAAAVELKKLANVT